MGVHAEALRANDAAAFAALFRAYLPKVRRLAAPYAHCASDVDDLVQEVFLHLFTHLHAIDPERTESLPGWVVTSAHHRMVDLSRQQRRRQLPPGFTLEGTVDPSGPGLVWARQLERLLARFEAKLKPEYRRSFRAVFIDAQTWDQASAELQLSPMRARYLRSVLGKLLRRHAPLREHLGRD